MKISKLKAWLIHKLGGKTLDDPCFEPKTVTKYIIKEHAPVDTLKVKILLPREKLEYLGEAAYDAYIQEEIAMKFMNTLLDGGYFEMTQNRTMDTYHDEMTAILRVVKPGVKTTVIKRRAEKDDFESWRTVRNPVGEADQSVRHNTERTGQ